MNPNSPSTPLSISVNSTPTVSAMEDLIPSPLVPREPSSSLWDWSDLLDFTFNDDHFNFSLDSDQSPPPPLPLEQPPISAKPADSGRTRKRDPRLTCENFLAGRVPCACPEMDAAMKEEEELPGRKKKRMVRAPKATVRCQVPDCKADISELKGYHRRHRVCLRCANAKEVLLGQMKRYCQQCGKFHILSDFDEGKRSCRRKLERHNIRRRRKPSEPGISVERESERLALYDDLACDDDNGKDTTCLNSQIGEREPLLESEEGQTSVPSSDPESRNVQSDDVVKFAAFDETQVDFEKNRSKSARSSVNFDKKLSYTSVCPTGRISFKLYDWNPAEFPRRLRHQIFQWLASMPVELEGYIRPGCTILTTFVAMPNFMWCKLLQEPVVYIADLVTGSEKMLSGRGNLLVYLDNMIFRVLRDGISVTPIKVEEYAPRLHYVHPTCFEAGMPVEFVVCGNNLLQPKFRFLVSFCGKYLAYEYYVPSHQSCPEEVTAGFDYQLLKIYIPHTEPGVFGPAFVEVENQSGLSNFIPILIGSREICSEMKIMEQRFEGSKSSEGSKLGVSSHWSNSCEALGKQTYFSQFILDVGWLTRKPAVEDIKHTLPSFQMERFNRLFSILIENNSTILLERVLHCMEAMVDIMKTNSLGSDGGDTDMELLQRNMADAKQILSGTLNDDEGSWLQSRNLVHNDNCSCRTSHIPSVISSGDQENLELQDPGATEEKEPKTVLGSTSQDDGTRIPLLNEEVVMNMMLVEGTLTKSLGRAFTRKHFATRPLILAIACFAVCLCVCAVFVHPQEVDKIVATIRSSLFENRL